MKKNHRTLGLSKNQQFVFDALAMEQSPLSAYTLLDRLRDKGLKAPLQIYRALEKLAAMGLVHRLDSLNAYVACNHKGCQTTKALVFEICDECGSVAELADEMISRQVAARAQTDGFELSKSTIELHGRCTDCCLN